LVSKPVRKSPLMTRPTIYVAITNHGYGHATRMAAVLAEIVRRCPDVLLIIVTNAPRSLLESYLREVNFIYRPRPLDVGVIQSDGLTMDKGSTRLEIERIQSRERMIIAGEVNFIRLNRVQLVLADIPPLAASIAKAAGIPCWMISNFGWDFIYQSWGTEFAEIVQWIQDCFRQCDRLFRLPFHEAMSTFPEQMDVGLTGGSPWYEPDRLRQELAITTPNDRTVLLTFGGLGLQSIPYTNLARFPHWQFLTFDRQAPSLPNLIKIEHPYRPVDVMPLCHCIISKPGYGTFSEACRVGVPIITLTREDFPESLLLLEGIQNHAAHRIISPLDFFQGSWDFLHQPFIQPLRSPSVPALRHDGNETIAQTVADFLS
ncbi:MAG: glycosyl transferase, partial [Prochlorotrichaceae cyanobacterium]